MGWGDLLEGIGGGLQGGVSQWNLANELKQKKAATDAAENARIQAAQIAADSRRDVASTAARGREVVAGLNRAGNIDLQRMKNEGMSYVQELENQGLLDVEEKRAISRLNLKNIDKEIAAAHDTANVKIGAGHDVASVKVGAGHDVANMYGSNMAYAQGTDVANINQAGQTQRADADRPLRIFTANQRRFPTPSAAGAARATRRGTPVPAPEPFGPSYQEFIEGGGARVPGAALPDQFPPPSSYFPPVGSTGGNMSPAPPRAGVFGAYPDLALPPPSPTDANTVVGPQLPPAAQAAAGPPKASLQSSGFVGGAMPVAGTKSIATEERLQQQAEDLMARITAANQEGNFTRARTLKQQLADLVKKAQ